MTYIRLKQGTVVRNTSAGLFLFDPINETSLVLNFTGAEIVETVLSKGVISLNDLLKKFKASYPDISSEIIQSDIIECLNELRANGFVVMTPEADSVATGLTQLHIEVTQKCNERCIHCYIPNCVKDSNISIDCNILLKTLKDFVRIGGEEIVLTGGEPFTYDNLSDIIYFCRNNRVKVSFLTNLIDADMDLVRQLHSEGLLGFIQTSVYSMVPAVHDGITKVRHSLARTLTNVEHLLEYGVEVNISTPIMAQNKDEVGKIIEFARNRGIGFRANADIIEQTDGNKDFVNKYALSFEDITQCYSNLINTYGEYAFSHLLNHRDCDKLFCESPSTFVKSNVCSAGSDSLSIDVHGNIHPCPSWHKMILGNIKKDSIEDVWCKSNILEAIRTINKWSEFPQCLRCEALNFCKNCLMKNAKSVYSQMNIPDSVNCAISHFAKRIYQSTVK